MGKKDDLEHAHHNEKVFLHLLPNTDFSDWIVTTAFYSALHFVDAKIFPITHTSKGISVKIDSLDSYAMSVLNEHNNDKHTCRLNLVKRNLKALYVEFNWLSSTCKTARYHNYKFPNEKQICDTAKEYLDKIKTECIK